ncbi:phosphoribosylglycinamide formyltransferase [Candidatus Peregrinibacteria bacterium CG10_big_fil_rev_8_21_14_0_10_36_19]|nr:MAG: phosphoribosylglycinamide formyltransferase [Candidatus Peregrinibacteria bacterium CG10_big_fil_rev_8_21_14_0_10_36_19]
MNIAVLASTNGTDLQAIIDEIEAGKMPNVNLKLVASNKKCPALERAQKHDIPTLYIDPTNKTRQEFDEELIKELKSQSIDLVVLVGYMRILTPQFIKAFPKQIINVHPSLIPKYSGHDFYGKSVHEAVIKNQETESGMTIHYVDEGVDTGEIILQKTCPVTKEDTPETLKQKVQELEKKWYPEVIRNLTSTSKNI